MSRERDAVVGGGIVGLALARALARRGRTVTVFESDATPQGASVRNFGTLWPVGQPPGPRRALALESLAIWREVLERARLWSAPEGSLHLAYHDDEFNVLSEFAAAARADGLCCEVVDPARTRERSPQVRGEGLRGALWSPYELQVNPRQVMARVPTWLQQTWGVHFEPSTHVTSCSGCVVRAGQRAWEVDRTWIASGADLRTVFPEAFGALGLRRCKLQMMRTSPVDWPVGPVLAGGLTLAHYEAFRACPSLPALKARLAERWPSQVALGVHVLVSRHDEGQLVLGDSHEYDEAITPFDHPAIDALVLEYLSTFLATESVEVAERWHGIYVKHPVEPYCVFSPESGVTAVVGLGGHGMTLSFGLAEQVVRDTLG
jgi:FAD dependent oxidoreductase TIGR03364